MKILENNSLEVFYDMFLSALKVKKTIAVQLLFVHFVLPQCDYRQRLTVRGYHYINARNDLT
jgi:hypothetical protein